MPQLDAGGFSESWFLRYAGDLHWEAIGRQLGVASDQICAEGRERLYPTVVALRARYDLSLSVVRENHVLEASVEVVPCGGACAHGRVAAAVGPARLSVELLTTFASKQPAGHLRMALPAARLAARWAPVGAPPALAALARAARRGLPLDDRFAGPILDGGRPPLGRLRYEPSPYSEYNGAGLLYFASYPTIADTVERRLVRRLRLGRRRARARDQPRDQDRELDWALGTSPVKRDVFYYANLPLGQALVVELLEFQPDPPPPGGPGTPDGAGAGVKTRVRLRRADDGQPIADVVTRRLFVRGEA